MGFMKDFSNCLLSPKLYQQYNGRHLNGKYMENNAEKWGDNIISSTKILWNAAYFTIPVLVIIAYQRGYLKDQDGIICLGKIGGCICAVLLFGIVLRAFGRASNPKYIQFNNILAKAKSDKNAKKMLQNYEFDFWAWPVDFDAKTGGKMYKDRKGPIMHSRFLSSAKLMFSSPGNFIGYLAFHSFGIKIMYPGSMAILSYLMRPTLISGRKQLVEHYKGNRYKVSTEDDNELDVFFVDRRGQTALGNVLVLCTEGNAGFYEIGIMTAPLGVGYSVLGWNHPGFGYSTGKPYVSAEQKGVEAVLQFAFDKLDFGPGDIILFGWSIGGFASSYAATLFPEVKAVILDATFDEVLPLALNQMPGIIHSIVATTIKSYADLNVAKYLRQYPGPLLLLRRTDDEIISTVPGDVTTNRGNFLLIEVLKSRFPHLFDNSTEKCLMAWLSKTNDGKGRYPALDNLEFQKDSDGYFYSNVGMNFDRQHKEEALLQLARMHMKNFPLGHCSVLSSDLFKTCVHDLLQP